MGHRFTKLSTLMKSVTELGYTDLPSIYMSSFSGIPISPDSLCSKSNVIFLCRPNHL